MHNQWYDISCATLYVTAAAVFCFTTKWKKPSSCLGLIKQQLVFVIISVSEYCGFILPYSLILFPDFSTPADLYVLRFLCRLCILFRCSISLYLMNA